MFKYVPYYRGVGETSVIAAAADGAIQHAAQTILAEAKRLAEADGLTLYSEGLRIDTGARPKGRGFARVVADVPDAAAVEWGADGTERLRILGQAAGVQVFPDVPQ